ncbi:ATP-binding protein [Prosthecomicrobium sp. N25]|uniref:ATP-binding protein n=1 Tax=Prosthecomicrobium sp. N25 TaxID=3129254 RepID=UPI003078A38A
MSEQAGEHRERPGARWPGLSLIAAAAVLVMAALVAGFAVPVWAAVIGGGAILLAAWAGGVRPETARIGPRPERRGGPWPDAGMRAIAEGLADPCFLIDRESRVRFMNRAAAARFGTLPPGDPLSFLLRVTVLNDAIARALADGEPDSVAWSERIPTERWLEAHLSPIRHPPDPEQDGRPPDFVLVVIEDETERRRAERMRVDFVANASHELRTPLAALSGFIETLQGPARNDPAARERFLAVMAEQARRMRRLIDDLLSLSRIEMKAHVRPDTPVDLGELVRHVGDSLGPLAAETGVTLAFDGLDRPMPTLGDRDELVQVFSNLIENAIKYGGSGKTVEVRGGREGPAGDEPPVWTVAVADHGPGIAPEHLPRLTERFYRADIVSSREKQGTGLGLAIVKHILARHRGRLGIASVLGQGATFTVRLEALDKREPHPIADAAPKS